MGTSDDQAILNVKGQALVTFRAPCDAVLQLRQTSIGGLEEKVDASELEKRPLLFSWQDGTVESVCADHEDPAWVVNIKRAVLSMLQHTAQFVDVSENHVMERDVIGRCPTKYLVEGSGQSVKVIKTKNPNQCSERIGRHSSIPSVAYNVPAETQTLPVMNSTSICKQQIKEGIVQSTKCEETHLFRPLSSEKGGARTDVSSSITLVSTASGSVQVSSNKMVSSNLVLDPRGIQLESTAHKDVEAVVRSICEHLESDSPARVSQLFTELVHSMRKASTEQVKAAYTNLLANKVCLESAKTEKMFMDALPQAGTTGTIVLMADILKENKLSTRQSLGWYLSLPLSKFVSHEAIKAVLPLVESASNSPIALLSLTSMARRYCVQHPEECQTNADVLQLSTKVAKMLANKCQVSDAKDEVKVIAALKALGNLGVMTPEVRSTVAQCVKSANLPITIRLAAIEASRKSPCVKEVKENLLSLLEDQKEDSEVRIAAYLGVMRCSCSHSLLRIQNLLAVEEHDQVGSFITSHLENIKSNPTPGKAEDRRRVNKLNRSMARTFPNDLCKYSRNIASNDFCNINNAGWDIDANIIHGKSIIPRSASLNMTIDMFGQSVNLFEIGIRTENLERLLENFLGPDGVLEKEGVSGILEKAVDKVEMTGSNLWNRLASTTRSKRASIKSNELVTLDKIVNMKEKTSDVKIDAFLRIFGAEIGMLNYRGDLRKVELLSGIESRIVEAWRDIIQGAKNVNIDVARSLMLLDTTVVFPTVAGFPLRLSVNGTTTVGLGLQSQMDLPAILRDPLNANIKLKLNPLAVTELSAAMTVDIAVAKTGIKMAATVHSSMAADFTARLQQGTAVEVRLDMPKSKVTLVDFTSELLLIEQVANKDERSKEVQVANKVSYERGGCSERTTAVTGMRLCASSSLTIPRPGSDLSKDPAPAFPLSGPARFSVVLEKSEPSMKGYLLLANLKQQGPKAMSFDMTLDTPGSTTSRTVTVKGSLTTAPTLSVKVEGKAPWGSVAAEGEIVNQDTVKSIQLKIVSQDKREYFGKINVDISRADRQYSYAGSVEAAWPQQTRAVLLEGKFAHVVGSSIELSLKPSGPYAKVPLSVQGAISREFSANVRKIALTNLEIITPLGKMTVSSDIGRNDLTYSANYNMKYGREQSKMQSVTFNGQVQKMPQNDGVDSYKTNVLYKSSRFPQMNIDLKWDLQHSFTLLSNTMILVHGLESEQATNRLYINQYSLIKGEIIKKDYISENKLEVTYPRYALNFKMDQQFKVDERNIKGLLTVQLDNLRLLDTELAFVLAPKDPRNLYELNARLAWPGRTMTLTDTGKRIDANSFSMSPVFDMQPGRKIELNGKASLISDQNGLSVNLDSELRVEGVNSPIKLRHSFQSTRDKTVATSNTIEWDGQPQLVLSGKMFQRTPTMPAVELSLIWNGRVDGKLEARISKIESKVDLDVNLIRLQRRVKVNSQHKSLGDNRSGSITVAWDADKDASKQLTLDGSLTLSVPQRSVDLKTNLSVQGRAYSFSTNGKLGAQILNGDHSLKMEATGPIASRKGTFNLIMSNVNQPRKVNNKLEIEAVLPFFGIFTEETLRSGNYKLVVNNAVNDLDRSALTWTAVSELSVKVPKLEESKLKIESKRVVKGDKRNTEAKVLIDSARLAENIEVIGNVEVTRDSIRIGSKLQRGTNAVATIDATGKMIRQANKVSIDSTVELKAPTTSWKQSKLVYSGAYDITSLTNFDISEKLTIDYQNGKTIKAEGIVKLSPGNFELSTQTETPFQRLRRQSITISGHTDPSTSRVDGAFVLTAENLEVRFEMERRPGQQLVFKLNHSAPLLRSGLDSGELSFDGRRMEDGKVLEMDLTIGVTDRKAKLTGRLSRNSAQNELDVSLALPNENPIRVIARVGIQAPVYNVNTRVDWGSGVFEVEGTTKFQSINDIEIQLKINSPELGINNYELKGSRKVQGTKRTMELNVAKASTAIASIKTNFERKDSRNAIEIIGSADVSVIEPQMAGSLKFQAEKRSIEVADERGSEYKLVVDVTAGDLTLNKINGQIKTTTKEQSGLLSACTSANCREASYAYRPLKTESGKEAFALLKTKQGSVEEVQGLRIKVIKAANKYEQVVELLFDEAKNRLIGYKAYKNNNEFGLEVFSPKMKSAVALEIVRGSGRQIKSQYILSVWMDKMKNPERKLVIAVTVEPHKLSEMEGWLANILIKHPLLPREIEYKIELHGAVRGQNLLQLKIDADVMDVTHKRWILETRVKNLLADSNGRNYTLEAELRSQGTDVSALLAMHAGVSAKNVYTVGATLKLKEKERIEKELFVRVNATHNSASVVLGSPLKQMMLEGRWMLDQIVSHSRLQLSGSSRIFGLSPSVVVVDMNTSPHVDVRVFSKSSPENYHQMTGGLVDDRRFELALVRQLNVEKKDLAAVYVHLNSTNMLTTRITWSLKDLKQMATTVRSRSQAVAIEIDSICESLSNDLETILSKWEAFRSLESGVDKLADSLEKQLDEMVALAREDDSLKVVVRIIKQVENRINKMVDAIEEIDIISDIIELVRNAKERLSRYIIKMRESTERLIDNVSESIEQWIEDMSNPERLYNKVIEVLSNIVDRVNKRIEKLIEIIKERMDEPLSKAINWYRSIKIGDTNVSAAVRDFISKVNSGTPLRQRIVLFIEETILSPIEEYVEALTAEYPETSRIVFRYIQTPIRKIREFLNKMAESTEKLSQTSWSDVRGTLKSIVGEVVVYDPKNGEIRYQLPLYRKVNSLRELVNVFDRESRWNKLPITSSLKQTLNKLRTEVDPSKVTKHMKGHAILIGSTGVITFDDKAVDVNGNCQYLLARDFLNEDFAVALNIEDQTANKKSVIFAVGTDQVEIKRDQVLINGKAATLPAKVKQITVSRKGNVIEVKRTGAITLRCDADNDICSMKLSPLYIGRTMGLWGTFTNEQADDMTEPNGKISKDKASFVNSWKLNKSCKDVLPQTLQIKTDTEECDNLFEDHSSELSSCFGAISPKPYHKLCLSFNQKAKSTDMTFRKQVQSLKAAYTYDCERWGISL